MRRINPYINFRSNILRKIARDRDIDLVGCRADKAQQLHLYDEVLQIDWLAQIRNKTFENFHELVGIKLILYGIIHNVDFDYVVRSLGSLGSGNHFCEVGRSQNTDDIWITIHSGSRHLGKKVCEYWQKIASNKKVFGFGETREVIKSIKDFSPKGEWDRRIKSFYNELKKIKPSPLDFLEGKEKDGYIEDMKFCQDYASMNRLIIMKDVMTILNIHQEKDEIESVHNYIDFKDNIIRKGAIRSYIGERMIIPFNMRDGILICEGKSNPDWNFSAPHGAGRVYSRSKAKAELSLEKFSKDMEGIFSTSVCNGTIDESPDAYKDSKIIEQAIEPTAKILDRIIPIHNMKDIEGKSWKEKRKNVNN